MHKQQNALRKIVKINITTAGTDDWEDLLKEFDSIIFNMTDEKNHSKKKYNNRSVTIWSLIREFNNNNKKWVFKP